MLVVFSEIVNQIITLCCDEDYLSYISQPVYAFLSRMQIKHFCMRPVYTDQLLIKWYLIKRLIYGSKYMQKMQSCDPQNAKLKESKLYECWYELRISLYNIISYCDLQGEELNSSFVMLKFNTNC